jgi:hypothetical protein
VPGVEPLSMPFQVVRERLVDRCVAKKLRERITWDPLPARYRAELRDGPTVDRDHEACAALGFAEDLAASVTEVSLSDSRHR